MRPLRVLVAVTVVVALLGAASAGVAVADGGEPDVDCGGLHEAAERIDGTPAGERLSQFHDECHEANFPR